MCTSFIYRGNDTLIAMNYDNYGNNLKLVPYNENLFLVTAGFCGKTRPLFGVRSDGVFANQQFMPEYSGGKYKSGSGVISTIDFVEKVLLGELAMNNMDGFLNNHEIVSPPYSMIHPAEVNMPSFNIHTMLADVDGDSYIIEPGRGNLKYGKAKKFIVMSNCPLYEAQRNGRYHGFGADRQIKVEEMLAIADEGFLVDDAFEVLKAVQLNKFGGFCSTEFSFVYSANQNIVYYCYNRGFDNVSSYKLNKPLIGKR